MPGALHRPRRQRPVMLGPGFGPASSPQIRSTTMPPVLPAAEPILSADVALLLSGLGLPVLVLAIACAIAWAVQPGLSSGRA